MTRTYEVDANNVKVLYDRMMGYEADKTTRFKIKKMIAALKDCPEHGVDKDGDSWWCADFAVPIEGQAKGYHFKKNAGGEMITTCHVSVSEEIAKATVWELHFKPLREMLLNGEAKVSIAREYMFDRWAAQWGLADEFERKAIADEKEPVNAGT